MGIFRRFLFIIVILLIFFFAFAGIVGSGKPEVSMITPILFFLMMIAVILFIPVIRSAQREEKARKAEMESMTQEERTATEKAGQKKALIFLAIALPFAMWVTFHIAKCLP